MKNIVYASDDNFAYVLAASIKSLSVHNSDFRIFVLDSGISEVHKDVIKNAADGNIVLFVGIDFDEIAGRLGIQLKSDRNSLAALSRLFISSLLPNNLDKILYLDCDTLIVDSLDELYNTDISGYVLAGVGDSFNANHRKVLGLSKTDNYVNSGVLLINYKKWQSENVEELFINIIKKHNGKVLQGDQGVINSALTSRIKLLPPRYNMQTFNYDFSYKDMILYRMPSIYYSEEEILEGKRNVVIVHFTTCFASLRPWQTDESLHPFFGEWSKCYKEVGGQLTYSKIGILGQLYNSLPKKMVLYLCRFLQVYIKPFI